MTTEHAVTTEPAMTTGLKSRPAGPLSFALVARNARAASRQPVLFVTAFVEPLLYLLSLGIGVGALVGQLEGPGGRLVDYEQFVAPGLLASSAMFGAVFDTTVNVFIRRTYVRTYDSILATPMTPRALMTGEALWGQLQGALHSTAYLVVMAVLGLWLSPWAVLALPGAVLVGYAFGGAGLLVSTYVRSWLDFDFINVTVMPLFLFSGLFFPLDRYPEAVRWLVQVTPLYQGVHLERSLVFGHLTPALLVPIAYLAVMGTITRRIAARRLEAILQP